MNLRRLSWVPCLVLLAAAPSAAQDDDSPWHHQPERRVYAPLPLRNPAVAALEERIVRQERASSWGYRLLLLPQGEQPALRLAHVLRTRWTGQSGFDAARTFVIVCSLAEPDLGVLPPASLRDRLALGADRLADELAGPTLRRLRAMDDRSSPDGVAAVAAALGELVERVDERLAAQARALDSRWLAAHEAFQDKRAHLERQAPELSERLERLELAALDLDREGLDVSRLRVALSEARQAFRRGLAALPYASYRAEQGFQEASQRLAQVELTLGQLESARSRIGPAQAAQERRLRNLREHLSARELAAGAAPPEVVQAAAQADAAQEDARRHREAGRPDLALREVERSHQALERAMAALTAAPPEGGDPAPSSMLPWLVFGLGLPSLGLLLWGVTSSVTRSRLVLQADSLREATQRQAEGLHREVVALRALYLQASRPRAAGVPAALLTDAPAGAPRWQGGTAERLRDARSRLGELHRTWCALQLALQRSDVSRSQDVWHSPRALQEAIAILEDVPRRNLPVTDIRDCAQRLERLAASPDRCKASLEALAAGLTEAEAALERVLQARHSSGPLDDDYADLVEQSLEAAFLAPTDPVGASERAKDASHTAQVLDERVQRCLRAASDRGALEARLQALGGEALLPDPARDLQPLLTWAYHVTDRVTGAIDEGLRDGAQHELERAASLVEDVEGLSRGEGAPPDVPALREELRQAHEALRDLQREFGPEAWEDLETALLRAAARVELLEPALAEGRRVPRLATRLQLVRRALLQITSRLLQLRGERERVHTLVEELRARGQAVRGFAHREREAVRAAPLEHLEAILAAVDAVARRAAPADGGEEPDPEWSELLVELSVLEADLDAVRSRIGEQVLVHRRAWALKRGLEKLLRDTEDLLRHPDRSARPGARARLAAARRWLTEAQALLPVADVGQEPEPAAAAAAAAHLPRALALLQRGVRAAAQARAITDPRGLAHPVRDEGVLGDAQHAVLSATHTVGEAHRLYVMGDGSDPTEARGLLDEARALLDEDPAAALDLGEQADAQAGALIVEAAVRAAEVGEAELEARRAASPQRRRLRLRIAALIRQGEARRRARFEILGLGEDADFDAVDADIDAEDEDEASALAEAADEDDAIEVEVALEPTDGDSEATPDAISVSASDSDSASVSDSASDGLAASDAADSAGPAEAPTG